jgi:hypothetical protein
VTAASSLVARAVRRSVLNAGHQQVWQEVQRHWQTPLAVLVREDRPQIPDVG